MPSLRVMLLLGGFDARLASGAPVSLPTKKARAHPTRNVAPAPPDLAAAETPLFGRQAELGRLRQVLDRAIQGHGHVATVVDEAGIGKTQLVSTLAADALSQGCRVLIGRCHESDSILPFGPWVDACRSSQISTDEAPAGSANASGRRCSTTRFRAAAFLPSAPWPTTTAGSSVISRANLALCLAEVGEFAEAVVRGEEARQIAEEIDHPYSRIAACLGLGGVWVRQAEFEKAVTVLERGFRLCEEVRSPLLFPWIAAQWAYAAGLSGRVAEALPLLEQAVERAAGMRLLVYQSQRIAWLSEITLLSGRRDDAVRLGERALGLARTHKERGEEAWALRLLGQIHIGCDSSGGRHPEDLYRQALVIADELGMRPLVAHCHLGLGKLCARTGQRNQATERLLTAATMFRDMDMRFLLDQAETASNSLA